jgi:hypothetical protein
LKGLHHRENKGHRDRTREEYSLRENRGGQPPYLAKRESLNLKGGLGRRLKTMAGRDELNSIPREVIGAAIDVHRTLGPGLLESADPVCLVHELRERGMRAAEHVPLPVR